MVLFGKWKMGSMSPRKMFMTGAAVVLMTAVTFFTLVAAAKWEITINDNGSVTEIKTAKTTVGAVLEENGITVSDYDIVTPSKDAPISGIKQIDIQRAFEITISDIDGEKNVWTAHNSVEDVLAQYEIALDSDDEIYPSYDEKIASGDTIYITRVEISEVEEDVALEYDVVEEKSDKLQKGAKKVITNGENGLANVTYRVVVKNGVQTEKEEISRTVVREPVNKVIAVGTKEAAPAQALASRSGSSPASASRVIICRATAYDGSYETLGTHNPRTSLGRTPTVGTVAVDPSVIPLGSRLYIESVDGSYVYGECFAGDTGGGIRGNRVDLFMASRAQALAFGSKQVRVYIY